MEKKNILIIGASGQISQELIDLLLDKTEHHLTLYLRNKSEIDEYRRWKSRNTN